MARYGSVVYKTKRAAQSSINCTFVPALAKRHKVVRATINGKPVGWEVVFNV